MSKTISVNAEERELLIEVLNNQIDEWDMDRLDEVNQAKSIIERLEGDRDD